MDAGRQLDNRPTPSLPRCEIRGTLQRPRRGVEEVGFPFFEIVGVYHLGGGFKYFLFSSLPGEMIQFD